MKADTFPDGEGIFETILTLQGVPQLIAEHIQRARDTAATLGWKFATDQEITSIVTALVSSSPSTSSLGRLRLIFTQDGLVDGIHASYERWSKPAKLTLSSRTIDETLPLVGMKVLPYRENIEILEGAQRSGFDDVIRLNTKEEVVETSIANLFLKVSGEWITPPKNAGLLPGIIRAIALECALVEENRLEAKDLHLVESIFLVNSLKGFQPVERLDARSLSIDRDFSKIIASLPQFRSVG